jgi:tRNA A-37 threonylcarbamoyl transferase component Bud32
VEADARIALTGVRVVWSAPGCDGGAVVASLGGDAWARSARVIKAGDRGVVTAGVVGPDDRAVVVKTHRLRGVREVVASALGRSRLARQVRGARMVEAAGVATAGVVVLARGTDGQGRRTEVVVLERVRGVSVAHHAARGDLGDAERRSLAHRLGAQVGLIADAGLVNRDHKASNIVVRRDDVCGAEPVVVDTVGVRRSHPGAARVRMLFGLVVELVGLGVVPSRTDRMRVVRAAMGDDAAARRRVWRAVDALVRMHGDATPKDDPLVEIDKEG